MKAYIQAVKALNNLIANEIFDGPAYEVVADAVKEAHEQLSPEMREVISLSCNAEVHEIIF